METRQQEQSNRLNNGQIQWMRRVLTIFVGIPTALKLLSYEWGMFGLATLLCSLCMIEFSSTICNEILGLKRKNIFLYRSHTILMVFCGIFVCTITAFGKRKLYHDAALLCVNLILVFYHLIQAERIDHKVILSILLDLFAVLYIVSGFGHALLLRSIGRYGFGLQLLGLTCTWVCDSASLLFGRWFGKAKLAPSISPGKTLVGAVAGIGSSIVTVFFLFELPQILKFLGLTPLKNHILPSTLTTVSTLHLVFVGIVLGVLCILGDLVESLMKRAAHVKDSGQVFPGHGGCLDRMDSFLFVSPFLYFWARMIGL